MSVALTHRRGRAAPLVVALALAACGDPWMDPERVPHATEVVVIPVPRGPQAPPAIGPDEVEAMVRAARPDVLFVEVPPEAFDRVSAAIASGDEDPWLTHMPDVRRALVYAGRTRVPVEPISGWRPEVGRDWRTFVARGLPDDVFYARVHQHRVRRDADDGDDPEWVLGVARRRLVEWEASTLESAVPMALGSAAPSQVGAAHAARIIAALKRQRGRRVVIAIDAKYAARVERAATSIGQVRVIDPLAFLEAIEALHDRQEEEREAREERGEE